MSEPTVVLSHRGKIGHILLNRPKALNALDLAMIRTIASALDAWRDDPAIDAVVVEGAGGRAFCAGGDIRAVRSLALGGHADEIETFFATEYTLNQAIADYPKPYIALIDGICMGGGIGVSVYGLIRVVTDAAVFAMPETGIGFFPDIGASFILPRLSGEIGMYMALTGARLTGGDAAFAGLATHYTDRDTLACLSAALANHSLSALDRIGRPYQAPICAHFDDINHCFGAATLSAVLDRLAATNTEWSRQTLITLRAMSPTAVMRTFDLIRAGANLTLPECLAAELALTRQATIHPDFAEGVRAMVVDKDRQPQWTPATLEEVAGFAGNV